MIISISRNPWCLTVSKKSTSDRDIVKILQNCYFRYFGHTWPLTLKMILSTCRSSIFIWMPKINFIIHFYLDIYFKESCNMIGHKHFGRYLKNQNFSRYGIGGEISITILVFNLDYFQKKLMTKFFRKCKKILFWGHFEPFSPKFGQKWIFLEIRALSVFK